MQTNHPRSCNDLPPTDSNRHLPLNLLNMLCIGRSYCSSYQSLLLPWSSVLWKQVTITDISIVYYINCNLPDYYGYFCNYSLLCYFGPIFQVRMDDFTGIYNVYMFLIRSRRTLITNRLNRLERRSTHRYLTVMIFFIYYFCWVHWIKRW